MQRQGSQCIRPRETRIAFREEDEGKGKGKGSALCRVWRAGDQSRIGGFVQRFRVSLRHVRSGRKLYPLRKKWNVPASRL